MKEKRIGLYDFISDLTQGSDIVEYPKTAAVRGNNKIVTVNH